MAPAGQVLLIIEAGAKSLTEERKFFNAKIVQTGEQTQIKADIKNIEQLPKCCRLIDLTNCEYGKIYFFLL